MKRRKCRKTVLLACMGVLTGALTLTVKRTGRFIGWAASVPLSGSIKTDSSVCRLEREEEAGLLVHLPVPLGSTVWRVRENPACHIGVREAETFLFGRIVTPRWICEPVPFTLALLEAWGITVFQTEEEGKERIRYDAERASRPEEIPGQGQQGPGCLL